MVMTESLNGRSTVQLPSTGSQTAVESKSNCSCNHGISYHDAVHAHSSWT